MKLEEKTNKETARTSVDRELRTNLWGQVGSPGEEKMAEVHP